MLYILLLYIVTMAAGGIPITHVYIDRRFKSNDSRSNSDFKYERAESLQLP